MVQLSLMGNYFELLLMHRLDSISARALVYMHLHMKGDRQDVHLQIP